VNLGVLQLYKLLFMANSQNDEVLFQIHFVNEL